MATHEITYRVTSWEYGIGREYIRTVSGIEDASAWVSARCEELELLLGYSLPYIEDGEGSLVRVAVVAHDDAGDCKAAGRFYTRVSGRRALGHLLELVREASGPLSQ